MTEIKITYRPFWSPFYRLKKSRIPENWEEVSAEQLMALAKVYTKKISIKKLLRIFTGVGNRVFFRLSSYQRYKLMELLDFTEKTAPLNSFIIPAITVRGKKYLAPASLLRGMTFGQFIFVDTFFRNYEHSKSEDEMAGMLAALFLPENEPFSEENIPARRALMQHVDAATCEAVRFNYVLVFEWLMKVYPLVFPNIENADEKAEKAAAKEKEKKQHDSTGWIKIFESIVGDDIVNQEKYAALPLHTVLRYLTRKLKENMKRKH